MIGKIVKGSDASGLINYVTSSHDHEGRERGSVEMLGGTIAGRDKRELAAGFEALARLRPGLEQNTAHLMLRWTTEDRPALAQQAEMAHLHAESLGYQHWVAVSHGDHLHIAASRVNVDGSVVSDSWDWKRAEQSVRSLENRFGLKQTASSHLLDTDTAASHQAAPTAGELGAAGQGEASIRLQLQEAVDAALIDGPRFQEFVKRLQAVGVLVAPNVQSTGRVAGLAFALDGVAFKASRLGKSYSWGQLQKRGLSYEPSRDSTFARGLSDAAKGAANQRGDGPDAEGRAGVGGNPSKDSAALAAAGGGGGGADRGISADHGGPQPEYADGAPAELGECPSDGRNGGNYEQTAQRPIVAAGVSGATIGESSSGSGNRKPTQPSSVGDHGRSAGEPAYAGGPGGPGLEAGTAAIDSEILDGSEDAASALRKWARNARRALVARDGVSKPRKPLPTALTRLADLSGSGGGQTFTHVQRQLAAMGCERYEVGVLPPRHRSDLRPERTRLWTAEQVSSAVPWLRRMNALDRDVYIRPAPYEDGQLPPLIFVDDLNADQAQAMASAGLPMSVLIESSSERFHGWVRVSTDPVTRAEATSLARQLAHRFGGDPAAAAWNQYGRLCGFTNRKQSRQTTHGAPYARLHTASNEVAPAGPELLAEIRAELVRERAAQQQAQRRAVYRQHAAFALGGERYLESAAAAFKQARQQVNVTRSDGSLDESARDFGAACALLRQGWEPEHVEAALLEASPKIWERHRDTNNYARRTVEVAQHRISTGREIGLKKMY